MWFSVDFAAGKVKSVLSTGPENGYTHWGQYVCYMPGDPGDVNVSARAGATVDGAVSLTRIPHNPRYYCIAINVLFLQ